MEQLIIPPSVVVIFSSCRTEHHRSFSQRPARSRLHGTSRLVMVARRFLRTSRIQLPSTAITPSLNILWRNGAVRGNAAPFSRILPSLRPQSTVPRASLRSTSVKPPLADACYDRIFRRRHAFSHHCCAGRVVAHHYAFQRQL